MNKATKVDVRGVSFFLNTYTRNLELCARMNYETEVLDFIDGVKEDEVFFDLGACEGRFSLFASKKKINVYAFEPDKYNFKVLMENLEINRNEDSNFIAMNIALGSHDHEGEMMIGQPWEGGHQKIVVEKGTGRNDLNFEAKEFEKISIRSLDSLLKSPDIPKPNYLKVDIDGSERAFITGAKETLKSRDLKGLIIELNLLDESFGWIIQELTKVGFNEINRFQVPDEGNLFNILYLRA
tara:strand:- start:6074 stop:6790 length:717 start_codon:yes stop_codon:yes gene_type:complete